MNRRGALRSGMLAGLGVVTATKVRLLVEGRLRESSRSAQTLVLARMGVMSTSHLGGTRVVYWHRELPPLDGDVVDEHVVEATSGRVLGSIERHGDLWDRCHAELMAHAHERLEQEVQRLGGHYAHVLDEHIEGKRDDVTTESWLHGRFSYVLYRRRRTQPG